MEDDGKEDDPKSAGVLGEHGGTDGDAIENGVEAETPDGGLVAVMSHLLLRSIGIGFGGGGFGNGDVVAVLGFLVVLLVLLLIVLLVVVMVVTMTVIVVRTLVGEAIADHHEGKAAGDADANETEGSELSAGSIVEMKLFEGIVNGLWDDDVEGGTDHEASAEGTDVGETVLREFAHHRKGTHKHSPQEQENAEKEDKPEGALLCLFQKGREHHFGWESANLNKENEEKSFLQFFLGQKLTKNDEHEYSKK